ncbi:glucose dehydrogenase [Trichonephila clavipes]|nr:glucose dehydrogenase [Trichonephila clavipes]
MSYDYAACKISLGCLFGLDTLGKIKFLEQIRIIRAWVPPSGEETGRPNYLQQLILFDAHKRARAVQFDRLKITNVVRARKEIILSAGAINSPQLLMLSGIGPKYHLQQLGVAAADLVLSFSLPIDVAKCIAI